MAGFGVLFRVPEVQALCFSSHASHPYLPLGQVGAFGGALPHLQLPHLLRGSLLGLAPSWP